jgi:hypothetical protein
LFPASPAEGSFDLDFLEKSMRSPSSVFVVTGKSLALLVVAGSIVMLSGQKSANGPAGRLVHSSAAQAAVEYVNPGLVFSVVSANIASDGTISVDYKVTDGAATGLPLDINGVLTPGAVTPRFLAAYIPKGQEQFSSYITSTATAVTGGATATQAAGDSGGATTTVATGEYIYTFKTKAPATFDPTLTNRIGVYGSRNLTEWDLGTAYASTTFDFVPGGGTPAPRDVVRDADCNSCHTLISFHGGSRVGTALCIMCHQPQTSDPNTGESLDMKVFTQAPHGFQPAEREVRRPELPDLRPRRLFLFFDHRLPRQPGRPAKLRRKLPQSQERRGANQGLDDHAQPRGLRVLPRRCEFRHGRDLLHQRWRPKHQPPAADRRHAMLRVPHPAGRTAV